MVPYLQLQRSGNVLVQVDHLLLQVLLVNLKANERIQVLHDQTNLRETGFHQLYFAYLVFWYDVADVTLQN